MMISPPPSPDTLDIFCPMHLRLSKTGHITHIGPTLRKLRPDARWLGERFLEVLYIMRPREVSSMRELAQIAGKKLHIELREKPRTGLKGVVMPDGVGGFIVNLAFGISIIEAVRDFSLSDADFAPTDLTVEMLYLVEAKSAAMDASRKLNTRLEGAKRAAEKQAVTDTLTGLRNRRAMDQALAKHIESMTPFSLMHIDLDYFKAVNDTLGHAAGDHVLVRVGDIFRATTRHSDIVARVGGDEFVILMPHSITQSDLEKIGERVISALEVPMEFKGETCKISGSIGTAIWDATAETDADTLMDQADVALYASKNAGRGRQTFYDPSLRDD